MNLQSTLTDKGQTTVPHRIREALGLKARQQLEWSIREDGSASVRPKPSALELFGSLRSTKIWPSIREEKKAVRQTVARRQRESKR